MHYTTLRCDVAKRLEARGSVDAPLPHDLAGDSLALGLLSHSFAPQLAALSPSILTRGCWICAIRRAACISDPLPASSRSLLPPSSAAVRYAACKCTIQPSTPIECSACRYRCPCGRLGSRGLDASHERFDAPNAFCSLCSIPRPHQQPDALCPGVCNNKLLKPTSRRIVAVEVARRAMSRPWACLRQLPRPTDIEFAVS